MGGELVLFSTNLKSLDDKNTAQNIDYGPDCTPGTNRAVFCSDKFELCANQARAVGGNKIK